MFVIATSFAHPVHSSDEDVNLSKSEKLVIANERLRAKCDALSIIPYFPEDFLPTNALLPKYAKVLDEALAGNDSKTVFEEINKFISACEHSLDKIRAHKQAKYSPARLWSDSRAKQTQLETAITYAYYFRARKSVEEDDIIVALADLFYLRDLRIKQKGISMYLITDLEMTIRESIKSACIGDIDRLFALKSPSFDDLERTYARLKDLLRVQPPYDERHFLKYDLQLINDILDRAYLIKHSSFVQSGEESSTSGPAQS